MRERELLQYVLVFSLIEPKSGGVTESFKMKDVSYCACHPDNIK